MCFKNKILIDRKGPYFENMLVQGCLLSYVKIEHRFTVSLGDGRIYGKHWQQKKLTIKESGFYHTKNGGS
jgi:hypothetical protein